MQTLPLTSREAALLKELLTGSLSDLRMEIADTDNSFFKEGLRERKAAIEAIIAKLGPAAGADR